MLRIALVSCLLACSATVLLADDPTAVVAPPVVEQTVERAIAYLQTESAAWLGSRKCAACHHAPLPVWALGEANRLGYPIDKKFVDDTFEAVLGSRDNLIVRGVFPDPAKPDPRPRGRGLNLATAFLTIAARSAPSLTDQQKQTVRLMAEEIISKQQPDGSWEYFEDRTPIHESQTTDAVWIILALQDDSDAEVPEAQRTALAKARTWLDGAGLPDTHQGKAFKLWLALKGLAANSDTQPMISDLLALQRPDGGWSQTPDRASDAYATGLSLYVLALAGLTAERPEIKRAIDFLIATQAPDGSWPMTSRSSNNGQPTKLMTPITCAACSWAVLGLTRLVPKGGK
jgi:hypothetical protein